MTNVQSIFHYTKTNNFSFLQQSFPELYRLATDMDRYYSQDHSCALLKARLFAEVWCHQFALKLRIELDENSELTNKIKQLEAQTCVPPYVIDELQIIRANANMGVHAYKTICNDWLGSAQTNARQVTNTMQAVYELAAYLVYNVNNEPGKKATWQAPAQIDEVKNVELALNGNKEANYALAKQALTKLEHFKNKHQEECLTKQQVKTIKLDLQYWLTRSQLIGAEGTALLFAQAYQEKWVEPVDNENAETWFKKAINECSTGQAHYEFALYLNKQGQNKRAWQHVEKAAEIGWFEAITDLQAHYQKDQFQFKYWLEKGIQFKEPTSFTVDAITKLRLWLENKEDELAQKRARSALIEASARKSKGIQCISAYCDYFGYWNKQPEQINALNKMQEHYAELPHYLSFSDELFAVFKEHAQTRSEAIKLGNQLITKTVCIQQKALRKFELGNLIWQELQCSGKVRSPYVFKNLLSEAAQEGCQQAIDYLATPKGKAVMKEKGYYFTRISFKQPDRKKQKKAKQQAKKAKRK